MAVIPIVRCRAMKESLAFYTRVLDFDCVGTWPAEGDPAFSILKRGGEELHLSSHGGDGAFGQAIAILTEDVDALFATLLGRGLAPPVRPESPVHQGPVDQTWGTRELYVDDPSGNTVRFVQR